MPISSSILERMKARALEAMKSAYCPYSRFHVGASVLTKDGAIHAGCNVENASYGLTMCAERNAIFHAVATGHREISVVVIVSSGQDPTQPCGACRQVISEFGSQIRVVSFGHNGKVSKRSIKQLLPEAFGPGAIPRRKA